MGLRARIVARYFGDVVEERVQAALAGEDRGWRPLAGPPSQDVPWHARLEELRDAVEAYRVNPLAYRIVELTTDYVLGGGVRLWAPDPAVDAWLGAWWRHPQNRLDLRCYDLCTELSLAGELFLTLHVNPLDRMAYVRAVPAAAIDRIETNPEDLEDEWRYHQASGPDGGRWWTAQEMAHYAVNRLVGATRGQSDLAPVLPWLRRYKDWLTDRVRLNRGKSAFLWWVRLKGAGPKELAAKRAQYATAPQPGSIVVTNDAEEWAAITPHIDAQSAAPDGRALRLMIAAGAGLPLHFLAEGETANRATAHEMGGPTLRRLERRQRYFGWLLRDLARRALALSGRFGPDAPVEVTFEALSADDRVTLANAASAMAQALATATAAGWLDTAAARALFLRFAGDASRQPSALIRAES
jgi:hypothetical protein